MKESDFMNSKENTLREEENNIAQWLNDKQNNQNRFIEMLSDFIQSSYSGILKEGKENE
jgi:hypothetical protein